MHYKEYAKIPQQEKWDGFYLDHKYIEGFSPLFYEANATYWDLDNDADSFLYQLVFNYWSKWSGPHDAESVYLWSLKNKAAKIQEQRKEFFDNSEYFQRNSEVDRLDWISRDREHPDEETFSNMYRKMVSVENKIYDFIPVLLGVLIENKFEYTESYVNLQTKAEDTDYVHELIRNPGRNLLYYFHDQIVFENYVQYTTVPRLDKKEIDLLESGILLEPIDGDTFWKVNKIITTVRNSYRGWWT